mgnify:CR=1 FL=1
MKIIFFKKPFQFFLILLFLNVSLVFGSIEQDKTILIKKINNKIASLSKQRNDLKNLKRWNDVKENNYIKQIIKLKASLKKLGFKEENILSIDQKIKLLQKKLKYLNNNKTNSKNRNNWSDKKELLYKKEAGPLIDSIIQLKMTQKKN